MINLADQFGLNNNCGFNLTNFRPKVVREQFADVHRDYERSFMGSFCQTLLKLIQPTDFYLFFSMTKFKGPVGFPLTKNKPEPAFPSFETELSAEDFKKGREEALNISSLPEFVYI